MAEITQQHEPETSPTDTGDHGSRSRSRKLDQQFVTIPIGARRTGQSTGPRTVHGKERSKLNALKHGLFSKTVLLKGESCAEYQLLLDGLQGVFQPRGLLEELLVDNLAALYWRKRRLLQAENAAVSERMEFSETDSAVNQYAEAWDLSRAAMASGGLLKHINNRLAVREARLMLEILRRKVPALGRNDESRFWKKLYGQDHDGGMPCSLRLLCEVYAIIAGQPVGDKKKEAELEQLMDAPAECEIEILKQLEKALEEDDAQRVAYKTSGAVIPGAEISDRLMRYETHLSREIERILNRLERLQRMRRGQPVPPQVDVNISA